MKACDALTLLGVTRPTLAKYVHSGAIKVTLLSTGHYDYDDESVYAFISKEPVRKTFVYARVSSAAQTEDLARQIETLTDFCTSKGYPVEKTFSDVGSGTELLKRTGFMSLLKEVSKTKSARVVILSKDRLARVNFDFVRWLFQQHTCEIVVLNESGSELTDKLELGEEILSLLQCYRNVK